MLAAVTVTVKMPDVPAGRKTLSTLLRVSEVPPATLSAPENTFPRYVTPPTVTVRSRSLRNALPVVEPGASVQARVTRNGCVGSVTVPANVRVWPVAVNVSAAT
jgi:hypothetical protein